MIWALLASLFISTTPLHIGCEIVYNQNGTIIGDEPNLSVGSNGISVSLVNDDVLSGSLISATLNVPDSISSLSVSDCSNNLLISLVDNEDGTYLSSIQTNGNAGEYYVTLSSSDNLSVDCDPSEITSLYVYSDGINDCVSYCSMNDAKAKYFTNHVATEEELILLGREKRTRKFYSINNQIHS